MSPSYDDPDASRKPDRADWAGQRAMAWVIDEAPVPAALFPTLMVIARRCNEYGKGSYQSVATIAEKTGKSDGQVKRDIRDLKKIGLLLPGDESLVASFPIWKRPSVYDVPLHISGPKPAKESKNASGGKRQGGGMDAPPGMDATGWHGSSDRGGMDAPGGSGMDATQTKPLKNPSKQPSLSASSPEGSAAAVPTQRTEREIEEDSQNSDKPENPITRALLDAGCPEDRTDEVRDYFADKGSGWFAVLARKGHLGFQVAEALEDLGDPQPEGNPDHLAEAHSFEPNPEAPIDCLHCRFPKPNGRHKVGNQGGGYISPKSGADRQNRRSTTVLRAEQGLRVADELDREYGNGIYAREIRSPADQRVADGAVLYRKYKAREISPGAVVTPGGYVRMTDSHHPGRNYDEKI